MRISDWSSDVCSSDLPTMHTHIRNVVVLFASAAVMLSACSTNRYAKTNRIYKKQLKALTEQMRQPLPYATPRLFTTYDTAAVAVVSEDSRAAEDAHWVGAIHFNPRKPNYVIIQHTTQYSLQQTLHTFSVPHAQLTTHS